MTDPTPAGAGEQPKQEHDTIAGLHLEYDESDGSAAIIWPDGYALTALPSGSIFVTKPPQTADVKATKTSLAALTRPAPDLPGLELLIKRLVEKFDGGSGYIGPDGKGSTWGGERAMVYRNPDGQKAAEAIVSLLSALKAAREERGFRAVDQAIMDLMQSKATSLQQENERLRAALATADVAYAALDVADRLIERAYGTDKPAEWDDQYRAVAKARAALSPQGGDGR